MEKDCELVLEGEWIRDKTFNEMKDESLHNEKPAPSK